MGKIILEPNSTTQWHALVSDACSLKNIGLSEDLESYLVFMLMRFTDNTNVFKEVLGLRWLACKPLFGKEKQIRLQEVGDICLLLSGLFPEIRINRNVSETYYSELGQTSYANLSTSMPSKLFLSLSENFNCCKEVLCNIRKLPCDPELIRPLDLYTQSHIIIDTDAIN